MAKLPLEPINTAKTLKRKAEFQNDIKSPVTKSMKLNHPTDHTIAASQLLYGKPVYSDRGRIIATLPLNHPLANLTTDEIIQTIFINEQPANPRKAVNLN